MQMSIHAALATAKKYEDKLNRVLQNTDTSYNSYSANKETNQFVGFTMAQSGTCNGISVEAAENEFIGNYQRFIQNYKNLIKTRCAITRINGGIEDGKTENVLTVAVDEKLPKMTIAEVIVRQKNLPFLKKFISLLTSQYSSVRRSVDRGNEKVQNDLNNLLVQSSMKGAKENEIAGMINQEKYHELHDVKIVDPLDLGKKIQELTDYVDHLSTVYDATLGNFNGVQTIDIDYDE